MPVYSCHLLDGNHPNLLLDQLGASSPSPKNKDGRERGQFGIGRHLPGYNKNANTHFLLQPMADRYGPGSLVSVSVNDHN